MNLCPAFSGFPRHCLLCTPNHRVASAGQRMVAFCSFGVQETIQTCQHLRSTRSSIFHRMQVESCQAPRGTRL